MKKPISNFYTIVWVEVPDEPAQPPRGSRVPSASAMTKWREARAKLSRFGQGPRLAGAMSMLGLLLTRG